jgi:hypothetical protein
MAAGTQRPAHLILASPWLMLLLGRTRKQRSKKVEKPFVSLPKNLILQSESVSGAQMRELAAAAAVYNIKQ